MTKHFGNTQIVFIIATLTTGDMMKTYRTSFAWTRAAPILLAVSVLLLNISSCSGDESGQKPYLTEETAFRHSPDLERMRYIWKRYSTAGKFDSIISVTQPFYEENLRKRDTMSALYSAASIAQAYAFMGLPDSVKVYLDRIEPLEHIPITRELAAILCNIRAIHSLTTDLDYSEAIRQYVKGYDILKDDSSEINTAITLLTNITDIFYMRSDPNGMPYATDALAMSRSKNADRFSKGVSFLAVARMKYIEGKYDEALDYIDSIPEFLGDERYYFRANSDMLSAEIFDKMHIYSESYKYYSSALEYDDFIEPDLICRICLNFGDLCSETSDYEKAAELYAKGMELSYLHNNVEMRHQLLSRLSNVYRIQGKTELSKEYLNRYAEHLDNTKYLKKEREFSYLMISYRDMEHKNQLQAKELAVLKANRKMIISSSIALVVVILLLSVLILYIKQKKMYAALVNQHQSYMRKLKIGRPEEADIHAGDAERELFGKLETLMKENMIFKDKEISLAKISDILGTNRTYLSKAINVMAGMSFHNYINMYRINEATRIITSTGTGKILLKQLADELGFNSAEVFSKAFQKETGLTPSRYIQEISSKHQ